MTRATPQAGPPFGKFLARRLLVISGIVVLLNSLAVGAYYWSDLPALEAEVVDDQIERIGTAMVGVNLPVDAAPRQLYNDHPQAYAFVIVDRGGETLDGMNRQLIPPGAVDVFADDWITRLDRPSSRLIVGGHELGGRTDGMRVVFVMQADPARLLWRAYLVEFYEHVWFPILPLVLVLIGANTFLIKRGLRPISAMAAWARDLRPGAPVPPPKVAVPAEIADLVDATQRSVERLAEAFEAEKRFAAEAAHALRTPVAVLLARVDSLPPGEIADRLRGDTVALSRTVQQVLASSRADVLAPLPDARTDLARLAEEVTGALAPFAYERGVDLSLDRPEQPVFARADAEGAELALTNLVENAILHGGAGRVVITVGPGPKVSVRDHGPGLPDTDSSRRLFDSFWRGPNAVPGGAGLGLAIVNRVQRAQGGTVDARNADGAGALFTLEYLPVEI